MAKLVLLKTQADFAKFRASRSYQVPELRIRVLPSSNQNAPRFGFIVPKKILPKATERNLVRRRLKNLLTKNLIHFKPAQILFFPSARLLKLKYQDLEEVAIKLFKRAEVWKF